MKRRLAISIVAAVFISYGTRITNAVGAPPGYLLTNLGMPGGRSVGESINNAGQIVGYAEINGQFHAVCRDSASMMDLGMLYGEAYASMINESGQTVGYSRTTSGTLHTFLWNGPHCDLAIRGTV